MRAKDDPGSLVIKNGRILLATGDVRTGDVLMSWGRIREIGTGLAAEREIDAGGSFVVPGLIDIHSHAIGYETVSTGSLVEYAKFEASRGATSLYPTFFAPAEEIAQQVQRHLRETEGLRELPQIRGFRLESPYLANTGAGTSRDLMPISENTTKMLLAAGQGHIRIWDISPELPGAAEEIHCLSSKGIVCSIAHTTATIEQGQTAVDAGARLVTHLFDVFELPVRTEPGVYPPSLVDYLLMEDRVACEIIDDGTHVHPLLVRKTLRCKTAERLVLVTDSNLGAGLPPGNYTLPGGWGNVVIRHTNDGVRMVDREMGLAGSALTPIDSFRNAVKLLGGDLGMASIMSSRTPARLLGLNTGEIAPGKDGDVIILDQELRLKTTVVSGRIAFQE